VLIFEKGADQQQVYMNNRAKEEIPLIDARWDEALRLLKNLTDKLNQK